MAACASSVIAVASLGWMAGWITTCARQQIAGGGGVGLVGAGGTTQRQEAMVERLLAGGRIPTWRALPLPAPAAPERHTAPACLPASPPPQHYIQPPAQTGWLRLRLRLTVTLPG
jgi:hypothetical protein